MNAGYGNYGQPPWPGQGPQGQPAPRGGISSRVIIWSVVAIIAAIAAATAVIVFALTPHTYKIEFRAHWEDAWEPSISWGLDDDIQTRTPSISGAASTTENLTFTENGVIRTAALTVSGTPGVHSGSRVVDCTIFQDGKQVAYERGSGTVSCTAQVGKNARN